MDETVLLFNTAADPSRAARLHAPDCPMLRTATGRRFSTVHRYAVGEICRGYRDPLDQAEFDDIVADLNDRGFPVKHCKCLNGAG